MGVDAMMGKAEAQSPVRFARGDAEQPAIGIQFADQRGDAGIKRFRHRIFPAKLLEGQLVRSEEHTSELQSLMRNSYAVFCLKKKKKTHTCIYSYDVSHRHHTNTR